jgi:hypothetical protein
MRKRSAADAGRPSAGSQARYLLTWETLSANRDRARDGPRPEPSVLRVVAVAALAGDEDD